MSAESCPGQPPAAFLTELPPELLGCILAEIKTAQALSHLSLTCKALHSYIEQHGYRIFVQTRFPSMSTSIVARSPVNEGSKTDVQSPRFWKDAAHGLTTLSRNLDRIGFVAKGIHHPSSEAAGNVIRSFRRGGPRGPTMGFVPIIDSYEVRYGTDWAARKEVVAWSEGAKLILRARNLGSEREAVKGDRKTKQPGGPRWICYRNGTAREGVDDITTLNLLLRGLDIVEEALVGRASGVLERVVMDPKKHSRAIATFETYGMPVRYTTVHPDENSVAVACLGDLTVAIYSMKSEGKGLMPSLRATIRPGTGNGRTWSAKFLRKGRVAIGLGRTKQPIHVFDLEQYSHASERAIEIPFDDSATLIGLEGDHLPLYGPSRLHGTSIYSIAPLPPSSTSSGAEGDVFLSGAYDAHVRLHDLRLANSVVSMYSDPVDAASAIYSLLPIGQERFIAGGAQHSMLKVFDLRMPGQRLYHAADALPCSSQRRFSPQEWEFNPIYSRCSVWKYCPFHDSVRTPRNWNVFLGTRSFGHEQSLESSVYSLSRPSSVSPTFYAGVQNWITQIDLASILDEHPDPIYDSGSNSTISSQSSQMSHQSSIELSEPLQGGNVRYDAAMKWDSDRKSLNLTMYEQADKVRALS